MFLHFPNTHQVISWDLQDLLHLYVSFALISLFLPNILFLFVYLMIIIKIMLFCFEFV